MPLSAVSLSIAYPPSLSTSSTTHLINIEMKEAKEPNWKGLFGSSLLIAPVQSQLHSSSCCRLEQWMRWTLGYSHFLFLSSFSSLLDLCWKIWHSMWTSSIGQRNWNLHWNAIGVEELSHALVASFRCRHFLQFHSFEHVGKSLLLIDYFVDFWLEIPKEVNFLFRSILSQQSSDVFLHLKSVYKAVNREDVCLCRCRLLFVA